MHPRNRKQIIPKWIKTATKTEFKPVGFEDVNDFSGLNQCHQWLDDNGYDYGSTASRMPTAVCKKEKIDGCIPKWYNIDKEDIENYIDGFFIHNRDKSAFLYIKQV